MRPARWRRNGRDPDGPGRANDDAEAGLHALEAGVKLVVCGHTHDYIWQPAKDGQPIAHLIGGAPQPKYATFIQGTATRDALTLTMTKLDGTVVADVLMEA